jgi:alginate O-acetyltransferase complex protein AlgI
MPMATTTAEILGPAWLEMWSLALAIFAALKLFTWLHAQPGRAAAWWSAAYLLAWPGMDTRAFLYGRGAERPRLGEWMLALAKLLLGVLLLGTAVVSLWPSSFLQAWTGMIGVVLSLHFGLFHLLSCCWRSVGISAVPLMNWPILSTSVSEFWSRRWNLAFRDLTHRYVFRPLAAKVGAGSALWIGFVLSGIIHDVVISLPAGGGYGLPTLFFVIQAAAISLERSHRGKSLGLGRGTFGWLFTLAVLLLPAPLLFHEAFRENVVLPFLTAIRTLCTSG